MSKLIMLRGNSGSGKTTVAKELQKKFGRNTMIISQDMVRREILNVEDGKDTKAIPLLQELLIYGKNHSEVTILEGIMYVDWYEPLFRLAVQEFGGELYAWYFDLPFEETVKRHQTRDKVNSFGEEDMQRWWREKDFIGFIREAVITQEDSLQEIVDGIYQKVMGVNYDVL